MSQQHYKRNANATDTLESCSRADGCADRIGTNAINVPAPHCSSAEHRQFDFWLGEWDVAQGGKTAGRNSIRTILNGCAISEEWSGTGGFKGNSLNFYNPDAKRWHQTWIDSRGQSLALDGQFEAGSMTMQSAAANLPHHRITWMQMPDKSVRQLWQVRDTAEADWRTLFDGKYSAPPPLPLSAPK